MAKKPKIPTPTHRHNLMDPKKVVVVEKTENKCKHAKQVWGKCIACGIKPI